LTVSPRKSAKTAPLPDWNRRLSSLTFSTFWALGMALHFPADRISSAEHEKKPPPETAEAKGSSLPGLGRYPSGDYASRPCCLRHQAGYERPGQASTIAGPIGAAAGAFRPAG